MTVVLSRPKAATGNDIRIADALKSTALGVKNLQRVSKMLLTATTTKPGDPYEDLAELYGRMLGQWTVEMNHVAAIVGGFMTRQKNIGQEGVLYEPVPNLRQMAAVQFVMENAFATSAWMIDPAILRRIEPVGALSRINNAQRSILMNLLSSARFARLNEQEAIDGQAAYAPAEFLAAVRRGIWRELDQPQIKIDAYRRNLQRSYLELANTKINGASVAVPVGLPQGFPMAMFATSGDEKPLYRAELRALNTSIVRALARTQDKTTRAHLEGARDQIARILDPRFAAPASTAAMPVRVVADQDAENMTDGIENCWPDYAIRP
jgi:hypothetical protein